MFYTSRNSHGNFRGMAYLMYFFSSKILDQLVQYFNFSISKEQSAVLSVSTSYVNVIKKLEH